MEESPLKRRKKETHISGRKIHKSPSDLCISSREIGSSLKKLGISLPELGISLGKTPNSPKETAKLLVDSEVAQSVSRCPLKTVSKFEEAKCRTQSGTGGCSSSNH